MTREEAIEEINKTFEPAFANYIIMALGKPEIIRCKDCCFYAISKEKRSWCKDMLRRIQPEDFCSHAIRREEGEQCQPKE